MALDTAHLTTKSRAELDDLYRRGGVDRVPEGDAGGTAIVLPGSRVAGVAARLIRVLAWQGKVFDPGGRGLRNKITPFGLKAIRADVYKEKSWLDGAECIVLDYSETSLVAQWIRDEIREVSPGRFLGVVYLRKWRIAHFYLEFAG